MQSDNEARAQSAPEGPPMRLAPPSSQTNNDKVPADYIESPRDERCLLLSNVCEQQSKSSKTSQDESIAEARKAVDELEAEWEGRETILVEQNSVYGTALVMPQFARSTGWQAKLTILAARSYLFLLLNVFIQWMMLYSLMKADSVMDKFSGQMYLCNFGAEKLGCPDGPGCMGPGGTRFTPSRSYSYQQWNIQNFVKNSLKAVFVEHEADIESKIDPGEYGVESQTTRLVCTWLFILLLVEDAQQVITLLKLLWYVPSADDSWITHENGEVVLKIKGMPRCWKAINLFMIVLPKTLLWKFTADAGILFLMETPGMQDLIVNSTALTFILSIDELLFATITTAKTRYMMANLSGFIQQFEPENKESWLACLRHTIMDKFPTRLLLVTALWISSVMDYYIRHCVQSADGTYYSKPMYLPLSVQYSHLSAFLPRVFPIPSESHAFWVMPSEDGS